MDRQISIENSEYWWGGCVNLGHEMPYTRIRTLNLTFWAEVRTISLRPLWYQARAGTFGATAAFR